MTSAPVTPEAARKHMRRKYDRYAGAWAAAEGLRLTTCDTVRQNTRLSEVTETAVRKSENPVLAPLVLPLHPPTERSALADQPTAIAWTRSWAGFIEVPDAVLWGERRWANLGTQRVPERLVLETPADVARVAGRTRHWTVLSSRFTRLLATIPGDTEALAAALSRVFKDVSSLQPVDFERLLSVLRWLALNPTSNLYIRQLPVHGVDTKWVGAHRALVHRLHCAASGRADLGLATKPDLLRVRFLDTSLAPAGLTDVSAPLNELAALRIHPHTVLVIENLETVLALPPFGDTVAVHGSGYAVARLRHLPWVQAASIVYWGDLDTHGFAILNRLRSHGMPVRSVLMDTATLNAFTDLCVLEPTPNGGHLGYLTEGEQETLRELVGRGNARLEQERIDWSYAVEMLSQTIG